MHKSLASKYTLTADQSGSWKGIMRLFVSLLFLLCFVLNVRGDCSVPPTFWCDDPWISKECGVPAQCKTYKDRTSNKKVNITLLYESLCPFCQSFIKHVLYPDIWESLSEITNIELVPFGNTQIQGSKFTCQHGPKECLLNTLHGCGIKYLTPDRKAIPFVYCMEMVAGQGDEPDEAAKTCLAKANITRTLEQKILSCWHGSEGQHIQWVMAKRSHGIVPVKYPGVPWILVNNRSTKSMQNFIQGNFLHTMICDWYNGSHKPEACGGSAATMEWHSSMNNPEESDQFED